MDDILQKSTEWHLSRFGTIKQRLLTYRKLKNDCWIWTKSKTKDGYGVMVVNRKQYRVHRLSYQEFVGEIPSGLLVCHKCDTPLCFNPSHLFLGTVTENALDMVRKERNFYQVGECGPNAKQTTESVLQIKKLRADGLGLKEIASMFNTTFGNISQICKGKTWKHL